MVLSLPVIVWSLSSNLILADGSSYSVVIHKHSALEVRHVEVWLIAWLAMLVEGRFSHWGRRLHWHHLITTSIDINCKQASRANNYEMSNSLHMTIAVYSANKRACSHYQAN